MEEESDNWSDEMLRATSKKPRDAGADVDEIRMEKLAVLFARFLDGLTPAQRSEVGLEP